MSKTRILTIASAILLLGLLQACASSDLKPDKFKLTCKTDFNGNEECSATAEWDLPSQFAGLGVPALNASQFVVTREVKPSHLSYNNGTKYGTLVLELTNGSTVSYSGPLAYSAYWSNQIPPHDSSKQVIAFVPANASAVQSFINQYGSQAVNAEYSSTVTLSDDYNGDAISTYVDAQFSYQGTRAYAGRGLAQVGDRPGGGGIPPYFTSRTKAEN